MLDILLHSRCVLIHLSLNINRLCSWEPETQFTEQVIENPPAARQAEQPP